MEYKVFSDRIKITGKEDFDIEHILECGQVFSFVKTDHYVCFSADQKADIFEDENGFEIVTKNPVYFEKYFDLKTDYSQIKKQLSKYEILKKPIKFGHGIRILRQNLFEAVISFIVSQNNNIKRIKNILFKIRENFGRKIDDFYAFPTREELLKATEEDFAKLGCGYRAKYLYQVIRQVDEQTLVQWSNLPTLELRSRLVGLIGIGPKVADCILLFGYGKGDVYPVDTWIRQMYEKYFDKCDNREVIRNKLTNMFGNLSGYAQQYLFFSIREKQD